MKKASYLILFVSMLLVSPWSIARIQTSASCQKIKTSTSIAFAKCYYKRAKLDELNRPFVDFTHANLSDASLKRANLPHANFTDANLSYADLSNTNLFSANLDVFSLRKAKFDNAILDYVFWKNGKICASGSIGECKSLPKSGNDIQDVIQTLLYHPDLRNLTVWTKSKNSHPTPYIVATNQYISSEMRLGYFSRAVMLKPLSELKKNNTEGDYLYVYRMSISERSANVSYKFPEYGLEGDMNLQRHKDGYWQLLSSSVRYSMPYHTPAEKHAYLAEKRASQEKEKRKELALRVLTNKRSSLLLTPPTIKKMVQAVLRHPDITDTSMFHLKYRKLTTLVMLHNKWVTPDLQLTYLGKPVKFITEEKAIKKRFVDFFEIANIELVGDTVKVHYGFPDEAKFGTFDVYLDVDKWVARNHFGFESSSGRRGRLEKFFSK